MIAMLAACTIQPRRYRPGFHIEFRNGAKDVTLDKRSKADESIAIIQPDTLCHVDEHSEMMQPSVEPSLDSATQSSVLSASETTRPSSKWERRLQRWASKNYGPLLQSSPEIAAKLDPSASNSMSDAQGVKIDPPLAGKIFAWIGFGLVALSFSLFIYSFFYKPQGGSWGDLALLVSIIVYSWLALAFALVAQLIFWISGSVTPWYQWPALTLGVLITLAFVVGKIKG